MGSYAPARTSANPFKVLILGSSYSGLSAAINLLDLCGRTSNDLIPVEITFVDERDGFYHLIGSPLALADQKYAEKAWVEWKDIAILQRPNVKFVHGSVSNVNPISQTAQVHERKSQTTRDISYDYFIAATGLRRVWPVVPQSLSKSMFLLEAGRHIEAVKTAKHAIVVVGGGAVGIEMAAELKLVHPHVKVVLAHSRDRLLSSEPLPSEVGECALDLLKETGVEVLMNHRLDKQTSHLDESGRELHQIEFTNGHKMIASEVVMAISKSVPSTTYLPKETLNEEGYVKIHPNLSFNSEIPNADKHFASGDLILWSGIKRCGAAMHEGKYAANNIHQLMLQETKQHKPEFLELADIPPMIGLAVGKKAVGYGPDGLSFGEQVMKLFFEDDLGFRICYDYLKLGQKVNEVPS